MQPIESSQAPKPIGPYSQAVRSGGFIFASGQVPLNPATGQLAEGGIVEQTRQSLNNLRAVLQTAGSGLDRVVKTTVFMTDLKEFGEMNRVYAECFSAPYPARATVQVAALPAGARVEIEAVAEVQE